MMIAVTKTHINTGKREDESSCPIALALMQMGSKYVSVAETSVYFQLGKWRYPVHLPAKAIRFIASFDAGRPVKPFRFTLKVPRGTNL